MTTRQTSIDCYHQIKNGGLLSKQRLEVYYSLLKMGKPSTAREVYSTMNVAKQEATRFTELRNLGVIYEFGTRKCSITGRTAIEWDLTDGLPIEEKISAESKKDRVNNALNAFRKLYKNKNTANDSDWKEVADLIKLI